MTGEQPVVGANDNLDDAPMAPADADGGTDGSPAVEQLQAAVADPIAAELERTRAEAADNYDRLLRTAAELDNQRKRAAKVRVEAREDALRDVLLGIAPVLDNLNRALAQETADAAALRQGIELIRTQFLEALKAHGLTPIAAVGAPFDPNLHEAMLELPSDAHPPGTVIEQTEAGYMLNKKVVRPARVIVSRPGQ